MCAYSFSAYSLCIHFYSLIRLHIPEGLYIQLLFSIQCNEYVCFQLKKKKKKLSNYPSRMAIVFLEQRGLWQYHQVIRGEIWIMVSKRSMKTEYLHKEGRSSKASEISKATPQGYSNPFFKRRGNSEVMNNYPYLINTKPWWLFCKLQDTFY